MKGRIFVVDHDYMINLNKDMEIKAKLPPLERSQWYKSVTSLLADMFQVQLGDYAFLWETKGNNSDSFIWGVYRIISNPFFDRAEPNFIKFKIEPAYLFKTPLTEYDILNDPYNKIDLWNIVGKKIAEKHRASTQLSPYETEFLIQKLIDKNPSFTYLPYTCKNVKIDNEIRINFDKFDHPQICTYSEIDFTNISYINRNGTVKYEKFMELLFNYFIKNKNYEVLNKFGIDINNIFWYANYLPYSMDKSEIDYLIMEASDCINVDKINVIEFQKGKLDEDHINRTLFYSKWINSKLAKGSNLANPILVCEKFNDLESIIIEKQKLYNTKPLKIYTINLKDGIINIEKRR